MELNLGAALGEESQVPAPQLSQVSIEATLQSLDVEEAKKRFPDVIRNLDAMKARVEEIDLTTEELNVEVAYLGTTASQILQEIEHARKAITGPHDKFCTAVNAFAKVFSSKAKAIKDLAGQKNVRWTVFKEQERQKKELEARKAAADLKEKMEAEARALNEKTEREAREKAEAEAIARGEDPAKVVVPPVPKVEPVVVVDPIIPKRDTVTRTEAGAASITHKRTFRIIDEKLIPREYLKVDEKAIRKDVDAGVENIPGVEIFVEARPRYSKR
jgi:hypothetical protein